MLHAVRVVQTENQKPEQKKVNKNGSHVHFDEKMRRERKNECNLFNQRNDAAATLYTTVDWSRM